MVPLLEDYMLVKTRLLVPLLVDVPLDSVAGMCLSGGRGVFDSGKASRARGSLAGASPERGTST